MLSQVFHDIEKKIIHSLQPDQILTISEIEKKTGLQSDQVRRGIEWLKLKNFAHVKESTDIHYHFGEKGHEAIENGLPERRLVNEIEKGNTTFDKLKPILGLDFNAAIAYAKKNDWISITKNEKSTELSLNKDRQESLEEKFIITCKSQQENKTNEIKVSADSLFAITSLKKRPDFIIESSSTIKKISLTDEGKKSI